MRVPIIVTPAVAGVFPETVVVVEEILPTPVVTTNLAVAALVVTPVKAVPETLARVLPVKAALVEVVLVGTGPAAVVVVEQVLH